MNVHEQSRYHEVHARSLRDPEGFWGDAAREIDWIKPADKIFDPTQGLYGRWFAGAVVNTCYNALGLCSQIELDFEVQRAAKEKPTDIGHGGPTLLPASETTRKEAEFEPTEKQRDDLNVDAVFAKLKTIGGKKPDEE